MLVAETVFIFVVKIVTSVVGTDVILLGAVPVTVIVVALVTVVTVAVVSVFRVVTGAVPVFTVAVFVVVETAPVFVRGAIGVVLFIIALAQSEFRKALL